MSASCGMYGPSHTLRQKRPVSFDSDAAFLRSHRLKCRGENELVISQHVAAATSSTRDAFQMLCCRLTLTDRESPTEADLVGDVVPVDAGDTGDSEEPSSFSFLATIVETRLSTLFEDESLFSFAFASNPAKTRSCSECYLPTIAGTQTVIATTPD